MRKIIILALIIFGFSNVYSQTVNGIPLSEIDVEYVEIVGSSKMTSNKLTISLDFGQENKVFSNKDTDLRDEDGKKKTFNSMIDALNFMSKNGYKFIDSYALSTGNQSVYHYLLRRGD